MSRRPYANKLAYIVKSAPSSRQVRDPFTAHYAAGLAIEPPLPPEQLLLLAEENAIHAACLKAKADDAVGRGWRLAGPAEPMEEVTAKLESLTPDWTFAELLTAAAWELEAIGWSAWEVVRQGGHVAALYPLPAHTLRAVSDPEVYLQVRGVERREFKRFGVGGKDSSEVIVFRAYSPRSPFYGLPRWVAAIPALAELTAIREYNISFFASGGTADKIIGVKAASLAGAQKVAEDIQTALREAAGRGHVTLVTASTADAGLDVHFLSPQAGRREGHFLRRRDDLVKEVLMAHGVPPYRIGLAEVGSLAGNVAREMLRAYSIGVIEPLQTVLETRLNQSLFGPSGLALKGRWKLNDLGFEETELNLQLATAGVKHGMLTPNEGRRLLGYDMAYEEALEGFYLDRSLQPLGREEVRAAVDVLSEFKAALCAALEPEPEGGG